MNNMFKIAKQEFKMTAANKAFIIITIIGPFLILALTVLPTLLVDKTMQIEPGTTIGISGIDHNFYNVLSSSLTGSNIEIFQEDNIEKLRKEVTDDKIHGFVTIPDNYLTSDDFSYYSKNGTDLLVFETLNGIIGHMVVSERLQNAGFDAAQVNTLSAKPGFNHLKVAVDGDSEGQGFMSILFTALSFVMLIYMTVLLYGQMIGRSVVNEKTSKTVELMLSSVTPRQLMFGKIFGIGLAGLVQYAFWITIGLILITFIGPAFDLTIPQSLTAGNLFFLALFFVLAYFMYSAAYAALGSAAEDEMHLGQLGMPLIFMLIIPLMVVSPIVMNPASGLAVGLSLFPFTAPLIMLVRILVEAPPVWEIAASIGIVLITILLLIWGSAKIFRVGILMSGKRFKFGEIIKWIRY